jgi:hypothetical protein
VRHDPARVGASLDDHVAEVPVVRLHVTLAGAALETLLEELPEVDAESALCGHVVRGARVLGDVQSGDAELARRADDPNQVVDHDRRVLLGWLVGVVLGVGVDVGGVRRLVADGVDALVDHPAVRLDDLVDRIALREVDRVGVTVVFGQFEPARYLVYDVDFGCALDLRAVGGHQPNRAGAEDRDRLAGLKIRQLGAVPAGREDVREKRERVLVFSPLGEF